MKQNEHKTHNAKDVAITHQNASSPVRLWNLSSFCVILQVGNQIFQHLASRSLLHSGKLRSRVGCSFAVHDLVIVTQQSEPNGL